MIDLDHNATTRPWPEVVNIVARVMRDAYANPGSRHAAGRKARQVLEEARDTIAAIFGAAPSEVVFTSGGTEATNLALRSFAPGSPGTVLVPPGEHPATEETVKHLQSRHWRRHTLPVDDEGRVRTEALDDVPWNDVRLATVLLAHNETGVIQEIAPLVAQCRERGIPLHVDAVQAAGKIAVDFHALGATTLAIGAHKFHGPRGIGALLVRDDVRLPPIVFGGHQESGRRAGTECVALAAGMAAALQMWHDDQQQRTAQVRNLRDRLQAGLAQRCALVVINGSQAHRLPNTLNIAFPGVDGDALLVALDLQGICCSLGSTCASGSSEPAPILVAMGCPPEVTRSSVRLSVGYDNTPQEIEQAIDIIAATVNHQRGQNRE